MAYEILWRVHAVLMSTSFLSMLAGVLISLIWKQKKWRYKTHRALGLYAIASGGTALLTAVLMVQISSGYHFTSNHGIGGGITAVFLLTTPLIALRIKKSKNKKRLRLIHRILGYTTLLLMAGAIIFGLQFAGIISLPF